MDVAPLVLEVQTGTGSASGLRLGIDDANLATATYSIPVEPNTTYAVRLMGRGLSGYAGVPFTLGVHGDDSDLLNEETAQSLNADWQPYTTTFTTGASDAHVALLFIKESDATDVQYQVGGVMLVEGNQLPAGYNAGDPADLYDNITARIQEARWYLGFKKPYQDMPHSSLLNVIVSNQDRRFSPEHLNSNPLGGWLEPLRPACVRSDDGTASRTHWCGWLESIQPESNPLGERTATLKASGPEAFFSNAETTIELQENKRTDEIVTRLLDEVDIPPALPLTTIPDVPGYSELDSTAWVTGSLAIDSTLDAGKTTLAYAADNWVRRNASDQTRETFNIYRALQDTVAAERGRLFFDREGRAIFWNRHHTILNRSVVVTLDDDMTGLDYHYAGDGEFANDITVTCHPRQISSSEDVLLWQLEDPIQLQPEDERELGAAYTDDSDNRIGGRFITLTNVSLQDGPRLGTDLEVSLKEAGANHSVIQLRNRSNEKVVLETCEIRGQKITDFGRNNATAVDHARISRYGHRPMSLNLLAVDDQGAAQAIADFELIRRREPSGKIRSVRLTSHARDGGNLHAEQLMRTIGDRVQISETQTGHSGEYFIIGEEHRLQRGSQALETTWYLESATDGDWFVIDDNSLDSGAVLIPY